MEWYLKVLRQYVNFHGRAQRKEYWMFALFNVILSLILTVLDSLFDLTASRFGLLSGLYGLAVLLPALGVSVRRLHDTGRSGWWLLLAPLGSMIAVGALGFLVGFLLGIPLFVVTAPLVGLIIGSIVLIVFYATDGDRGPNKYGPDPKAVQAVNPATVE